MYPTVSNFFSNLGLDQQSSLQSGPLQSRFTQGSLSNQKSTDISIITADGDKITISNNISQQVTYSTYNWKGEITGTSYSIQKNEFSL